MSPTKPGATGTDDENVAIAEMVRQGIRKAREKLIDLSLRNGMLNYRHSESSSRHVRVVHQLPSAVVECLASEKSIDLVPLPPVETIPRDEDTDVFRAALREAKAVDPEWLAAEDAKRAAGSRRRSKDKAAERSLRDRVRVQLGMPEWRAATDPKVRAQELGVDPSYDLKDGVIGGDAASGHPKLQTLFFPDRLEPKLSAIHAAARTLQEDAGISALSCAVGFLEWYDSDDGPTPAYAPLLLLPINMEKRVAGGEYVFSIVGRDDDETRTSPCARSCGSMELSYPNMIQKKARSIISRPSPRPCATVRAGACAVGSLSEFSPFQGKRCGPTSIQSGGLPRCGPMGTHCFNRFMVMRRSVN
jgi:hypothetical protein